MRSSLFACVPFRVAMLIVVSALAPVSTLAPCNAAEAAVDSELGKQIFAAGENKAEIEKALAEVPDDQRGSMEFLVENMPQSDLQSLSAKFLLENVRLAHEARDAAAWKISDELFLNYVLPYANVDETREAWRPTMRERANKIVAECKTPGEAAQRLNQHLFKQVGVKYSTKRKKANQSPQESIDQGLASCTGLSILLVDACRSVNVPARLVGVPSWTAKRGNHTWVEVWGADDWHFTGAAEYNAKGLDRGWFVNDASKADKNSRRHSIYAISFEKTETTFPIVWSRGGPRSYAVNVTERYTRNRVDEKADAIKVHIRIVSEEGTRVAVPVKVCLAEETSEQCAAGISRGERADTNDLLSFDLKREKRYRVQAKGLAKDHFFQTKNAKQQTLELVVANPQAAVAEKPDPAAVGTSVAGGLSRQEAADLAKSLYEKNLAEMREKRKSEWEAKEIKIDDLKMKFDYRVFGEAPENGRSLFISMHGGGGAPARVNESQWQNQIKLYEPKEGVYLAPRAPTDTWNLWHQSHIDKFFARIIEDAIALEGVDPNRVYIMGYSAGGDGVYQLAPRMADQLAAAAMMAGHPNGVSPLGLRNIGFTLHMGGKDAAYKRNKIAAEWKEKLAKLKADDPGGYEHEVVIHPEMGHWMRRKDAVAVDWMAKFTRNPLPNKVVWHQTGTTHSRFYWLAASEDDQKPGAKMVVSRNGNEFTIHETEKVSSVIIRLNDAMIDFDEPLVVKRGESSTSFTTVRRSKELIEKTLGERADPESVFSAEIEIKID